jgi:hypothetical protein
VGLVLNCEKCRKVISKEEWNDNLRCCYKCKPKKEKRRYLVTYNEKEGQDLKSIEFELETTVVPKEKEAIDSIRGGEDDFPDEVIEVNDYLDEIMWETEMFEKKIERIEGNGDKIKIFHYYGDFEAVE